MMQDVELQHRRASPSRSHHHQQQHTSIVDDEEEEVIFEVMEQAQQQQQQQPSPRRHHNHHHHHQPSSPSSSKKKQQQPTYPSIFVRMPNTAFGIAMGLAGNAIVWKTASGVRLIQDTLGSDTLTIGNLVFWGMSVSVVTVVGLCYLYKIIFHFEYVRCEWCCSERTHFMNTPHLTLLMLSIGLPDRAGASSTTLRILWSIAFACQTVITQFMYEHWFFSNSRHRRLTSAKPQFLLSTVGWFLLSVLGSSNSSSGADIPNAWGLPLPAFCLGAGIMLYVLVVINIFNDKTSPVARGTPALFLLIAPPSVGVVAVDLLTKYDYEYEHGSDSDNNDHTQHTHIQESSFSLVSQVILGWCLVVVMLLLRLGPIITQRPPVLGVYWAYVFPLSALATALLRYASIVDTLSAQWLAIIMTIISSCALMIVFLRTFVHCVQCTFGDEMWGDPLLDEAYDMNGNDNGSDDNGGDNGGDNSGDGYYSGSTMNQNNKTTMGEDEEDHRRR